MPWKSATVIDLQGGVLELDFYTDPDPHSPFYDTQLLNTHMW